MDNERLHVPELSDSLYDFVWHRNGSASLAYHFCRRSIFGIKPFSAENISNDCLVSLPPPAPRPLT